MPLTVNVHGTKVVVEVSDGGMFHDKSMRFYAPTLNGLEKKMNATVAPGTVVPVENSRDLRQGVITGKKNYKYKIRWNDGKRSVLSTYDLRKPTTQAQRAKLQELEDNYISAQDVVDDAEEEFRSYEEQFEITKDLKAAFGT